jgi:hypothetical protein
LANQRLAGGRMDDETIAKFVQNLRGVPIDRDNKPPIANRGGGHNGPGSPAWTTA